MSTLNESASTLLVIYQSLIGETEIVLDSYGTLQEANTYFDNRLRAVSWKQAENSDKNAALMEATRLIDRLNYVGDKTNEEQLKQFPRGGDTEAPEDICIACYEIALQLLEGVDPDLEIEALAATHQQFGLVRQTYDRTVILESVQAGIPSHKAWSLLKPYLRDSRKITLSRVN